MLTDGRQGQAGHRRQGQQDSLDRGQDSSTGGQVSHFKGTEVQVRAHSYILTIVLIFTHVHMFIPIHLDFCLN